MTHSRCVTNFILSLVFSGIPLLAEYATASPGHTPSTGFDILLYKPFDFAYALFALIMFICINLIFSARGQQSKLVGAFFGCAVTVVWFIVSFLAVGQLHLSLGGTS